MEAFVEWHLSAVPHAEGQFFSFSSWVANLKSSRGRVAFGRILEAKLVTLQVEGDASSGWGGSLVGGRVVCSGTRDGVMQAESERVGVHRQWGTTCVCKTMCLADDSIGAGGMGVCVCVCVEAERTPKA